MKHSFNVRGHNYVYESVADIAFQRNSRKAELKAKFHLVFTTTAALTLALIIPGADPMKVLNPSCPFMRAANDMWDFMTGTYYKYGQELIFHSRSRSEVQRAKTGGVCFTHRFAQARQKPQRSCQRRASVPIR